VLLDQANFFALHRRWFLMTALASLAAGAWYGVESWTNQRLAGGGSRPGLAFGVAAALICLFELVLFLRKTRWFRTRRWLGSAQMWMKAHIWLGLLAVPLVAMHAGFRFGGPLSSLLSWCFILVIASGIFGLLMQNLLPRLLLDAVPEETVYSQIDEVGRQLAADAARLAGLQASEAVRLERPASVRAAAAIVVGAPRQVGTIIPRSPQPNLAAAAKVQSPELTAALEMDVLEFLRSGTSPSGRLANPRRIEWFFDDLRRRVPVEARGAVEQIEALCRRRQQLNLQRRIHFWLHSWLCVHLPLSAALIVLVAAHTVYALRFS
jgi:hypothetical protein